MPSESESNLRVVRKPSKLRRALKWGTFILCVGAAIVLIVNWRMLEASKGRIYRDPRIIPENPVAIVLGTSPMIGNRKNLFFESRMKATATLWKAGKIRHVLVSGDNGTKQYDEPSAMRDALIRRGVPAEAITLDHAGFRTLDTMARARTVFGLEKVTVITDDFHLPRSLFLAAYHGLQAVGFEPDPVPFEMSKKTRTREVISRMKAWLDVFILQTKPKFYGPKIELPVTGPADRHTQTL